MTSGHDPSLSIYLPITYAGGTGRQGESLVVGPFVIRVSVPCAARDLGEPRDHRTLPLRERQRPKGAFGSLPYRTAPPPNRQRPPEDFPDDLKPFRRCSL